MGTNETKRSKFKPFARAKDGKIERKVFFDESAISDVPPRKKRKKRKAPSPISKLGKTRLLVKGKQSVKFLGAAMKICPVSDVRASDEGITFCVPSKLLAKIVALLDNLCYDYKIIGTRGFAPLAARALARVGISVGLVAFVAMLAIYPRMVTRVNVADVQGKYIDGALNAKIALILSSRGVEQGKWLPSLDAEALSNELLALDGIAYAGVERHGSHINVLIKQELPDVSLWDIKGSKITANRLATVTRIIVEGGTAAVKYGDVVKPGDALIEGYVEFGEDKIPVEAKGRVYGCVQLKRDVFFGDVANVRTFGEVKRITKLGFFGKVPKKPDSPFESYELKISTNDIGFLLPIKCYTYEFRQVLFEERAEYRSDDELVKFVYSSMLDQLEEEANIIETFGAVERESGGRRVRVTISAEVSISA